VCRWLRLASEAAARFNDKHLKNYEIIVSPKSSPVDYDFAKV